MNFLKCLLNYLNGGRTIHEFLEELNMKSAVQSIDKSWNDMTDTT